MFVPLHVKSDYSLGYGTASVEELAGRAAALGYQSMALTDLENLYGQVRFHHACRARGLRAITGVELRPGFDGRRNLGRRAGRVVLLAMNESGYRSLCRIISRRRGAAGSRTGKGRLGEDPVPLVIEEADGLFGLSDDPAVVSALRGSGKFPRERLGILMLRPQPPQGPDQGKAARRLGVRLVADLDAVFPEEKDHALHVLQVALRLGRRMAEIAGGPDVEKKERWLRSPSESAALFADAAGAVDASRTLAEACSLDLAARRGVPPKIDLAGGETAAERVRQLCAQSAADRREAGAGWSEEHVRRLDEELAIFEEMGLSGFLLGVAEILSHCRASGIPVVARGSAVSSLTLYLLGASPVDPLAHGLLFERFLHPGKSEWPDVDLDLPWHRRDEVIEWVYRRFGRDRVAMVGAHHRLMRRAALREGLKAWGARPALMEALSRRLPPEDLGVEEVDFLGLAALEEEPLESELGEAGALGEALRLIQGLIGRPRHIAAHPGGMVIGDGPLEDQLPLERAPKGVVITQYELTAVAALGLIKLDLLGNRCLSELEEALLARESKPGYPTRLEDVPSEDAEALGLADRAATVGCFQLESPAMRSLLARVPIRAQSDIVASLALIRPGAAAGEAKAAFVRRARGEEADEPADPVMADRLAATHGMLLYEEDIMMLMSRVGGLSLGEADELRAAIVRSGGDAQILAELEAGFLQRAEKVLGPGEAALARARKAWKAAAHFAAYSFNKAHATSYGQLAYLSAYAKAHYPLEFACALLNHHQGIYPLRTLGGELVRMGVELRAPHVNHSSYPSAIEERPGAKNLGAVRVGLEKLKVLAFSTAAKLLAERDARGRFASLRDFLARIHPSRRELAALILSGACDGLAPLAAEAYPFVHEAALERLKAGREPAEIEGLRLRRPQGVPAAQVRLYQALVRVRNELRYLEMHITAHPMAILRGEASRYGCLPVHEAAAANAGTKLLLAATVAAMRRVVTLQGAMQFLTFEDETGLLEAAILPPAYRRLGERVTTPGPFLVEGRLRRQQGAVHLEVNSLGPFHERARPYNR